MNAFTAYENLCAAGYQRGQAHDEDIAEMEETLLRGEYNPDLVDNMVEALNAASHANDPDCDAINKDLKDGDDLNAMRLIKAISLSYCQRKAAADAPAKLAERREEMRQDYLAA